MDDLKSTAREFLRGPLRMVADPRSALLLDLFEEYGESGTLDSDARQQLADCERFAATQESTNSGDTKLYFSRAASLLRAIRDSLPAH